MAELAIRMIVSLAVVLGLLLLCARLGQKRFKGRSGSPLQVLHRQSLSRSSGVAVVSVGGRMLLLGTTDQQVQMLTELDPAEVEQSEPPAARTVAVAPAAEPGDSLLGRMATLVDEPSRWIPTSAKRRTSVAAVAPLASVPAAPAAPTSFATVLESELATELTVVKAAPKPLTPAQVLLQEEQASGPLAGSLLSADTWRLAARAVTRRAS
jgi:flagellar protein FliO/FliZ